MDTPTKQQPPSDLQATVSVSGRRSLFLACVLLVALSAVWFVLPAWNLGKQLVLPLDDVYIHFQYARQIANGQPYQYNPSLPPSSGATSLLYPYVLALGFWLGLDDLTFGYWALLWGVGAFIGASYILGLFSLKSGFNRWITLSLCAAFVFTGAQSWHFFSGMESGLLIFFVFLCLYGLWTQHAPLTLGAAALMAITRPEGAIMAIVAVGVLSLQALFTRRWRTLIWSLSPLLALTLQPLLNRWLTGSSQAAGNSAKSILSMIPAEPSVIAARIIENFLRMWAEFFTGYSLREGLYLPVPLLILALVGLAWLVLRTKRHGLALILVGWLLGGTLAVSTLDPAFWHFKRYQMPFMALLFPLAVWGLAWLNTRWKPLTQGVIALMLVTAGVSSALYFQPAYHLNVSYINQQQIPMARWLSANTPPNAAIAVHDVGMMRYLAERTTVDMVGLTTQGAAASWRHGPGALAEFLADYEPRPSYIASYTDALGLSYLADTRLYDELLAEYPVQLNNRANVALAGAYQGVWRIDWSAVARTATPQHAYYRAFIDTNDWQLSDALNVANLNAEEAHAYTWQNRQRLAGFPTEVYDHAYLSCGECRLLDGGRRINGTERFTMQAQPAQPALLLSRIHAAHSGSATVYVNGARIADFTLPFIAGEWSEVGVYIPAEQVTSALTIEIVPDVPNGHYMPYYHWLYQGTAPATVPTPEPLATFGEIQLLALNITQDEARLIVESRWQHPTHTPQDARAFLHIYDDENAPPVLQADRYLAYPDLPPGNWLPQPIDDTIELDISALPRGRSYKVVLGFYDAITQQRLVITSSVYDTLDESRLWVETLEVE